MRSDRICYCGRVVMPGDITDDIDTLLSCNYVYQDMRVRDYRIFRPDRHIEIGLNGCEVIHGARPAIDINEMCCGVGTMLQENRYPDNSIVVRLYITPDGWFASPLRQLLYEDFTIWHSRENAVLTHYENLFSGIACSLSLISGSSAEDYAKRKGCAIALRENYEGILTGVGDYPLIAIKDGEAFITSIEDGATSSVWRDLAFESFRDARLALYEEPLHIDSNYDELMYFSPQGVTNILSCGKQLFFNTATLRIGEALSKIKN